MINVFCVLVKPSYSLKYVDRLYEQIKNNLSYEFNFICLTDTNYQSIYPIKFIDVKSYELDTWWNKVLIFDKSISGNDKNLYFDLDILVKGNLDFLVDDIEDDYLHVVNTLWKDEKYFKLIKKSKYGKSDFFNRAFYCYGNSSVMGWKGNQHQHLVDLLLSDLNKHVIEHFGDDTFINLYGKIKYFQPKILWANKMDYDKITDRRIIITYKQWPIE